MSFLLLQNGTDHLLLQDGTGDLLLQAGGGGGGLAIPIAAYHQNHHLGSMA